MLRTQSLSLCLIMVVVSMVFIALDVLTAGDASRYPLDDKLANEPAPWTIKGKWGERGNWGR